MSELATLIRAWRDRVTPDEVGLPAGGDRRSPGLRREELSELATISVDYLVRLVVYTAEVGSADEKKLELLRGVGSFA